MRPIQHITCSYFRFEFFKGSCVLEFEKCAKLVKVFFLRIFFFSQDPVMFHPCFFGRPKVDQQCSVKSSGSGWSSGNINVFSQVNRGHLNSVAAQNERTHLLVVIRVTEPHWTKRRSGLFQTNNGGAFIKCCKYFKSRKKWHNGGLQEAIWLHVPPCSVYSWCCCDLPCGSCIW